MAPSAATIRKEWFGSIRGDVLAGIVVALAILIFLAQLPQFIGAGWPMYAFVAAGQAIICLLPRITSAVPSPLIATIGLTIVALMMGGGGLRTVGDMGALPTTLPFCSIPAVPFSLETLQIVLPVAITLALVGIIESLRTASIVDEMSDTPSDKNRESRGQGIAHITTGSFGGMAGCAMIGQSVINVRSGERGRTSFGPVEASVGSLASGTRPLPYRAATPAVERCTRLARERRPLAA